jgi:hypothetical protein
MARNRKFQSAASRFGPALKAFLLCLVICGSGLGYVWQKDQIARLGKQMKDRETHLGDLKEQNKRLRTQLATVQSQRFLEVRIKELNLGLGAPQPAAVWRLPEPSREPATAAGRDRQYAAQTGQALGAP